MSIGAAAASGGALGAAAAQLPTMTTNPLNAARSHRCSSTRPRAQRTPDWSVGRPRREDGRVHAPISVGPGGGRSSRGLINGCNKWPTFSQLKLLDEYFGYNGRSSNSLNARPNLLVMSTTVNVQKPRGLRPEDFAQSHTCRLLGESASVPDRSAQISFRFKMASAAVVAASLRP